MHVNYSSRTRSYEKLHRGSAPDDGCRDFLDREEERERRLSSVDFNDGENIGSYHARHMSALRCYVYIRGERRRNTSSSSTSSSATDELRVHVNSRVIARVTTASPPVPRFFPTQIYFLKQKAQYRCTATWDMRASVRVSCFTRAGLLTIKYDGSRDKLSVNLGDDYS